MKEVLIGAAGARDTLLAGGAGGRALKTSVRGIVEGRLASVLASAQGGIVDRGEQTGRAVMGAGSIAGGARVMAVNADDT